MLNDKKQLIFNLVFLFVLVALVLILMLFNQNFNNLNREIVNIKNKLYEIESKQNFNFIQGAHHTINYQLTPQGLYIGSADDFGIFHGPSMQPAIFDGNTVIEKIYEGQELLEGQIIRFLRPDGQAVIHRIRADYGDSVSVQGDTLDEAEIVQKDKITHIILGVLFT